MSLAVEIAANALNAASILLAGRNSAHTWSVGIAGCALFGWLFFDAKLYADATLQIFFIGTSAVGWWHWLRGDRRPESPIRKTSPATLSLISAAGALGAVGYGWLLHRFTDAFAPFADSAVLAGSVAAQLLLVARRVETWWFWLGVNTISVPLFASRGLWITAALYAVFWVNALVSLRHWRGLLERERA